jgi:hypothetical protein
VDVEEDEDEDDDDDEETAEDISDCKRFFGERLLFGDLGGGLIFGISGVTVAEVKPSEVRNVVSSNK